MIRVPCSFAYADSIYTLGPEGDGLLVGTHEGPPIAPEHLHDIVIGIGAQTEAHAVGGELGRVLHLLAYLAMSNARA
jgi:hypothetical protein